MRVFDWVCHASQVIVSKSYLWWLRRQPGVQVGRVRLEGIPLIEVRNGGRLYIEDNVRLKSLNTGYHVNMFAPVKLLAVHPGSVVRIGANSRIYGTCINAFASIDIGKNCLIAANCQIMDTNGHAICFPDVDNRLNLVDTPKPIVIEDSVWLGTGTIIMPGVRIGRGSIVGAGSVVTCNIPPMCLAGGNPARIIRTHSNSEDPSFTKEQH